MIFKIIMISHGWFEVDFNRQFLLINSGFLGCDAPALLLEALANLMERTSTVQWLCWQDEPGAYILKLELDGSQLIGEVYEADVESPELKHSGISLADHTTSLVYHFEDEMDKVSEAILTEFGLYEKGNGKQQYQRHWGDFPHREYGKLKMLLHNSSYGGTPPEGQLNGYQKKFFHYVSEIQEYAVQTVLARYGNDCQVEDALYDATHSVITDFMTLIDGYSSFSHNKMDLINQNTGIGLKENPFIELHDAVSPFIKYEKSESS